MTVQEIIDLISDDMKNDQQEVAKLRLANLLLTYKKFDNMEIGQYRAVISKLKTSYPDLFDEFDDFSELATRTKTKFTKDDFISAITDLKENFCEERINDAIKIGKAVYGTPAVADKRPGGSTSARPSSGTSTRPNSGTSTRPNSSTSTGSSASYNRNASTATSGGSGSKSGTERKTNGNTRLQNNYRQNNSKQNNQIPPIIPLVAAGAVIATVVWLLLK